MKFFKELKENKFININIKKALENLREKFIEAIKKLEEIYGPIANWNPNNSELEKAVFSQPDIHAYLTRDPIFVPFLSHGPLFIKDVLADEYELLLYHAFPEVIPFRDERVNTSEFYKMQFAVRKKGGMFLLNNLWEKFNEQVSPIKLVAKKDLDPYSIASDIAIQDIQRYFGYNPLNKPVVKIYPNWGDANHFSLILSVTDPETNQPLAALAVETTNKFFEDYKVRFQQSRNYMFFEDAIKPHLESVKIDKNLYPYLNALFNIDLENPSFLKAGQGEFFSESEKCMLVVGRFKKGAPECYFSNPQVELVYQISSIGMLIVVSRKLPFINIPLHLQKEKDDENCVLYGSNIAEGIQDLLTHSSELLNKLIDLSRIISNKNSTLNEIKQAEEILVKLFTENLKPILSCYYDPNGNRKSTEKIQEFHVKQRWEMGSKSLSWMYPPSKKEEEENLRSNQISNG